MERIASGALARAQYTIRAEHAGDPLVREALLDRVMGPIRFARASELLRAGQDPALALVATGESGAIVGTVRLWHVRAPGLSRAVMLGPLAVDPAHRSQKLGAALMRAAIAGISAAGVDGIVLVGDPAYYDQFSFRAEHAAMLAMPGPFERHRMLGLPLRPGAFDHASGVLEPAGFAAQHDIPQAALAA